MKLVKTNEIFPDEEYSENNLIESLLLGIHYYSEKNQLHFVFDVRRTSYFYSYLETGVIPEDKKRLFYHLIFGDVSNLIINGRDFSSDKTVIYSSKQAGGIELTDYKLTIKNYPRINLVFTSSNYCEFGFERLYLEEKWGKAFKVSGSEEWSYIDFENNQKLDFYNPFNLSNIT